MVALWLACAFLRLNCWSFTREFLGKISYTWCLLYKKRILSVGLSIVNEIVNTGDVPKELTPQLVLKPSLQEAITVIRRYGGRLTAHELHLEMEIGLSTAYTYLKQLHAQNFVERLKIQSATGTGKQYLYVMSPQVMELDGFSPHAIQTSESEGLPDIWQHDQSADPMQEVLDILCYLAKKVRILEKKLTNLEQEKQKHYPIISALKKEMNHSGKPGS